MLWEAWQLKAYLLSAIFIHLSCIDHQWFNTVRADFSLKIIAIYYGQAHKRNEHHYSRRLRHSKTYVMRRRKEGIEIMHKSEELHSYIYMYVNVSMHPNCFFFLAVISILYVKYQMPATYNRRFGEAIPKHDSIWSRERETTHINHKWSTFKNNAYKICKMCFVWADQVSLMQSSRSHHLAPFSPRPWANLIKKLNELIIWLTHNSMFDWSERES